MTAVAGTTATTAAATAAATATATTTATTTITATAETATATATIGTTAESSRLRFACSTVLLHHLTNSWGCPNKVHQLLRNLTHFVSRWTEVGAHEGVSSIVVVEAVEVLGRLIDFRTRWSNVPSGLHWWRRLSSRRLSCLRLLRAYFNHSTGFRLGRT